VTTLEWIGLGLVPLGLLAGYGAVMAWTGRWRSWTGDVMLAPQALPITVMPAMALFLTTLGLGLLGVIPGVLAGLAVFLTFPAFLVSFFTPRWWGPRWYREAERPFAPNVKDPLTALAVEADLPNLPTRPLPDELRGRPIDRWHGNLVLRDEPGMRHPLARNGKMEGDLSLYEQGVTFVAAQMATRLDGEPFDPVVVDADAVLDVRVVPAGAGPDGKKRRRTGLRSLFKRLVIDTPEGPLLFEVQRAEAVQQEIRKAL